jgi:hypothetical protein
MGKALKQDVKEKKISPCDPALTKKCTSCSKVKPLTEFWNRKHGKFGRSARCAECSRKKESEKSDYVGTPPDLSKKMDFIVDENGCYRCTSHVNKSGFGHPRIQRNKKTITISRLIYEECFGSIPEGMVVRHKCDNPRCINPEHLELGTPQDNVRDMVERNRQAKGSRTGGAKLTEKDVIQIKHFLDKGLPDT